MTQEADVCRRIGYLGAFEVILEPYNYSPPLKWPDNLRKAWRQGKSQAAQEAQAAAEESGDKNPYVEGSFAHRVFRDHLEHLLDEERRQREAQARRENCRTRFHEADSVQQLKEWIMKYHPGLLEPSGGGR